jgi:ubiquinone/menaquinone biosynthesis C-methylase UbiE
MLDHMHGKPSARQTTGSMEGWGKTYDFFVGLMTLRQEPKVRQATLELAKIRPGDCILEVGCGTGSLTLAAKTKAGPQSQVYGVDIAPDMIAAARQKAARAGQDVQFQVGRIETIPFPDGKFNLVLSSLMMHHVTGADAKQKGIAEILRVLIPGGRLLIVDIEPPQKLLFKGLAGLVLGREMLAHNVREFIPLLEKAGFINIKTGPTQYKLLSYLSGTRA